jgi:hypothetical protein
MGNRETRAVYRDMAKIIEVKLLGFTCEFAGDAGDDLEVAGSLKVLSFDDPSVILTDQVLFDFPDGPLKMRKGQTIAINRDVRVAMATPSVDPPGFGELFVKFGGEIVEKDPGFTAVLGNEWQTLHTTEVINPEPLTWRFYFGKHDEIVRADISTVFVHPL